MAREFSFEGDVKNNKEIEEDGSYDNIDSLYAADFIAKGTVC